MPLRQTSALYPDSQMGDEELQQVSRPAGFLSRFRPGLRPERDYPRIQALSQAIETGAINEDQVKDLVDKNPNAAAYFVAAHTKARQRKMLNDAMGQYFQDPKKPDFEGAAA